MCMGVLVDIPWFPANTPVWQHAFPQWGFFRDFSVPTVKTRLVAQTAQCRFHLHPSPFHYSQIFLSSWRYRSRANYEGNWTRSKWKWSSKICLFICLFIRWNRISTVGAATMLGTGRPEVRILIVTRDFSLFQTVYVVDRLWSTISLQFSGVKERGV